MIILKILLFVILGIINCRKQQSIQKQEHYSDLKLKQIKTQQNPPDFLLQQSSSHDLYTFEDLPKIYNFSSKLNMIDETKNYVISPDGQFGYILTSSGKFFITQNSEQIINNRTIVSIVITYENSNLLTNYGPILDYIVINNHSNILGVSRNQLFVMDMSNKENPRIVQLFQGNNTIIFDAICKGVDKNPRVNKIVAGVLGGFIQYDFSLDSMTLTQIGKYNNPKLINQRIYKMKRSDDEKFLFMTIDKVGLLIFDISNINNVVQASLPMYEEVQFRSMKINELQTLIYITNYMIGLEIWDYSKAYLGNYPIELTRKVFFPLPSGQIDSFVMTNDFLKLALFSHAFGIYIFNLANLSKVQVNQIIYSNQIGASLTLNKNEDNLIVLLTDSLVIYKKNQEITPFALNHVLNYHKNDFYKIQNSIPFSFSYKKNKKRLYTAFGYGGFMVFDFSRPPVLDPIIHMNPIQLAGKNFSVGKIKLYNKYLIKDGVRIFRESANDLALCIVLQSSYGLHLYNMSDVKNPVSMSTLNLRGDPNSIVEFWPNKTAIGGLRYFVIAAGFEGMYVVNFTDLYNPSVVSNVPSLGGSQSKIDISADNKFVFCVELFVGLVIYDISDIFNPKFLDAFYSKGFGDVEQSERYPGVLYLADGDKQFTIIKQKGTSYEIVSRLSYGLGWAQNVAFNAAETYAYLAQIQQNSFIVIDIQDLKNPFIVSVFNSFNLQNDGLSISPDSKYAFIGEQNGVISVPLTSTSIGKFTVSDSGTFNIRNLKPEDQRYTFQVGDKVDIRLTQFINPQNKIVQKVQQYINQQYLINLPVYMEYISPILTIKFQKENLGHLAVVYSVIQKYDQIECLESGRSLNLCNSITEKLKLEQIIDTNQFPIVDVNFFNYFNVLDNYIDKADSLFIRRLLVEKYDNIMLLVDVEPSLSFNNLVIKTLSQTITITMEVQQGTGKFVKEYIQGVIVDINDEQTIAQMTGSVDSVNENKKLLKFVEANGYNRDQIIVNVTIVDNINPPFFKQYPISQLTYIQKLQKLAQNGDNTVQFMFNQKYPNGGVFIEQEFTFQFSPGAVCISDLPFKFDVAQWDKITKKSTPLSKRVWVDFQDSTNTFFGKPLQNNWNEEIDLIITVYDEKYSNNITNYLTIIANRIPAAVVFTYIGMIGSPLITVLGFIRYRSAIYNMIQKKKYIKKQREYAYINEPFFKTINLLEPNYSKAAQVAKNLRKCSKFEDNDYFSQNGRFMTQEFINFMTCNKDEVFRKVQFFDQFLVKGSQLNLMVSLMVITNYMDKHQFLKQIFNKMKKYAQLGNDQENKWYLKYMNVKHLQYQDLPSTDNQYPHCEIKVNQCITVFKKALKSAQDGQKNRKEEQKKWINICSSNNTNEIIDEDHKDFSLFEVQNPNFKYLVIIKAIQAEILGIYGYMKLQFSIGECICVPASELKEIGAYVDNHKQCTKLLQCLNMNYDQIGMNENDKLPRWMNCELKQNCIYISGTPNEQDDELICIRIISLDGMNLVQFELCIEQREKLKDRTLSEVQEQRRNISLLRQNSIVLTNQSIKERASREKEEPDQVIIQEKLKAIQFLELDQRNTILNIQ